jgi:hypothetical protein
MNNTTTLIFVIIISYLLLGVVILLVFDIVTKRIRSKLLSATAETQSRMAEAGSPMSGSTAKIFFMCLMWLFWPAVLLGAATKAKDKEENNKNGN